MKVLIFFNKNEIKPAGGAAGYLYGIKKFCDNNKEQIFFDFIDYNPFESLSNNISDVLFKIYKKFFLWSYWERFIKTVKYISKKKQTMCFDDYDAIFFHSTFMMFSQKKVLENYKGTVFLTSHSPKVSYKEIIDSIVIKKGRYKKSRIIESAEVFDTYAFQRADYIIFPCKGAEEPYYHSWPKYEMIRDVLKIVYVPTGILPVQCKIKKIDVRKKI